MTPFEEIYKEHFGGVYRYVYSLCRNESAAEEITQETFYKAMENLDRFRGETRLFVWLCQIAKNTYFTYAKKQKRHVSDEALGIMAGEDLEESFFDKETAQRALEILHELSEPYKEVFTLRVYGQLTFSQIGQLFEKSDSWARLIYYRAKQQIRRELHEDEL
ncbi:MAG: sigma-70 family RNA polymerase sigma factor [Oscillospiraceae bacterium]|nr:sigma-70 family RNA polymerase sigma factor [Oscillospiraceae bacterium]